jgi:hypothetical protein
LLSLFLSSALRWRFCLAFSLNSCCRFWLVIFYHLFLWFVLGKLAWPNHAILRGGFAIMWSYLGEIILVVLCRYAVSWTKCPLLDYNLHMQKSRNALEDRLEE